MKDYSCYKPGGSLEGPFQEGKMRVSRIGLYVFTSLFVALWAGSCALFAQGADGTITGNVTDPTGAPIPAATVTIRNVDTNDTRSIKTGSTGVFSVTILPVGTYQMKVTASGFQTLEVQDIKLDVNATRRIDAHMTIGQLSESRCRDRATYRRGDPFRISGISRGTSSPLLPSTTLCRLS
jgi:Carboxypeptidase regulatory-like domain